jgi:nitrogen fixation/metabolism regulation signal transduction histidine kinase
MAFNRYYLNILVRIVFFAMTNLVFFYFLISGERFFTTLFLGILILVQAVWLFYYLNLVNLNLARFLLMLGEEETSIIPLKTRVERTFGGLQHSFHKLSEEMTRARLEREYANALIQHVVDNAASGVLAWDEKGEIELVNESALNLLGVEKLEQLEELEISHPGLPEYLNQPLHKGMLHGTNPSSPHKFPFSIRETGFKLGEKYIRLATFQDIKPELEQTEMESWEKLIRVLTHEVSNSVTPITTLGANIRKRLRSASRSEDNPVNLPADIASDIRRSAELIEQRGNGLIDFIGQYKSFMHLPKPDLRAIQLKDLIEDACRLGEGIPAPVPCRFICEAVPPGLKILSDRKMMEQVLLNLLRNATEAIPPDREGRITLSAHAEEPGYATIRISDNGKGIPEDIAGQVFIPFFTTKEKGSGIGLSFCRRIIGMTGGSIRIETSREKGTTLSLTQPLVPDDEN